MSTTDPSNASYRLYPTLGELMALLTGADRSLHAAFREQLVEWFMHRVYDEMNGPLSDAIAPIPSRPPSRR